MTHEISLSMPVNSWYTMAENLPKQVLQKQDFLAVVIPSKERISKDSFICFFPLITSLENNQQVQSSALAFSLIRAYLLLTTLLTPKSFIL